MTERRYLITGAASGIGAAAARLLAGPGVAIALHTRKNQPGLERVAADVRAQGGTAHLILGDLADPALPARVVEGAATALGGLDVVVANAGFADRTPMMTLTDPAMRPARMRLLSPSCDWPAPRSPISRPVSSRG